MRYKKKRVLSDLFLPNLKYDFIACLVQAQKPLCASVRTDTLAEAGIMSLHAIFSVGFLLNGCASYNSCLARLDNCKNDLSCLITEYKP